MLMFEYCFNPNLKIINIEDFEYETSWFMSALYKNGQISRDFTNAFHSQNEVKYFCEAFEEDSLSDSFYNEYCSEFYSKLVGLCTSPPQNKLLGKILDAPETCNCQKSSYYMLYTAFLGFKSPISCGDCKRQSLYTDCQKYMMKKSITQFYTGKRSITLATSCS